MDNTTDSRLHPSLETRSIHSFVDLHMPAAVRRTKYSREGWQRGCVPTCLAADKRQRGAETTNARQCTRPCALTYLHESHLAPQDRNLSSNADVGRSNLLAVPRVVQYTGLL